MLKKKEIPVGAGLVSARRVRSRTINTRMGNPPINLIKKHPLIIEIPVGAAALSLPSVFVYEPIIPEIIYPIFRSIMFYDDL